MNIEKGKKPQESLVDVVLDKIIANIDNFIPPTNDDFGSGQLLHKYFGIYGESKSKFSAFPPVLTEMILKRYFSQKSRSKMGNFEEFIKNRHVFAHLLNCMTKTLDLENILSYCTIDLQADYLQDILKLIEARAPNIESLFIRPGVTVYELYEDCDWEKILNPFSIQAIAGMKKLKALKVYEHVIRFSDLQMICKQLTNLSYVDVNIAFKSIQELEAIDFKQTFPFLKALLCRMSFEK